MGRILRGGPRTVSGLSVRASLLHDWQEYRRLADQLNGGERKGWNDGESAVVEAVTEMAVRRFFGAAFEAGAVAQFATALRRRLDLAGRPAPAQQDIELVMLAALGEQDADLSALRRSQLFTIRSLVTLTASDVLALDGAAIDQMTREAEGIAFGRGWSPPLAAE
jgi:hypothetical protein